MKKNTSMLKGLMASALPLPARLALSFGPPALKAYGDWRSMNGQAKATTKHRSRQLAALATPQRRRRFPWGVGLGGVALGALTTGAAALVMRSRDDRHDHDERHELAASDAPTTVIRPGVGTDAPGAPGTRTTIEQKHGRR